MRARQPNQTGYAVNDGVRIYYEVHGSGSQTVLVMPPHPLFYSRLWKMQVPYLAGQFRAVSYDGRGNGRSDRPASGYTLDHLVGDAAAVLDELQIARTTIVVEGSTSRVAIALAAQRRVHVDALVLMSPRFYGAPGITPDPWDEWKDRYVTEYDEALRYLIWDAVYREPHSSKPCDDLWTWAHETDPRTIVAAMEECWVRADVRALLPQVRCPVLLIHSEGDRCVPYERSLEALAQFAQSSLVTIHTPGHFPAGRHPVRINLLLRDFLHRHAFRQPTVAPEEHGA